MASQATIHLHESLRGSILKNFNRALKVGANRLGERNKNSVKEFWHLANYIIDNVLRKNKVFDQKIRNKQLHLRQNAK